MPAVNIQVRQNNTFELKLKNIFFKANLSFTNHYLWERSGALPHVSWIYVLWIHASWINAYCIMDTCIINTSVWVTQLELSKKRSLHLIGIHPHEALCVGRSKRFALRGSILWIERVSNWDLSATEVAKHTFILMDGKRVSNWDLSLAPCLQSCVSPFYEGQGLRLTPYRAELANQFVQRKYHGTSEQTKSIKFMFQNTIGFSIIDKQNRTRLICKYQLSVYIVHKILEWAINLPRGGREVSIICHS